MVTFDVRLSNTAAKSNAWIKIKPGTDIAVVLAMCNVVMAEGLYRGQGEAFLEFCQATESAASTSAEKIAALKKHLARYTPEWAQKISGVDADLIKNTAIEFAKAKAACVISSRGSTANFNGVPRPRRPGRLSHHR